MPVGILTDLSATLVGSILGCLLGSRLAEHWKNLLNNLMGIAALVMGITLIIKVKTLPAAILALILGALIGEALQLEARVNKAAVAVAKKVVGGSGEDNDSLLLLSAALVLFCFGGTGWYGALNEGITGDGSILMTKAILDFVTAAIFGTVLGKMVPLLSIPQMCVYFLLFGVSKLVAPYITDVMIADFSAAGGMITLVAGLRMTKIKTDIPVLNLLPGLILAFFVSAAWTALLG